MRKTVLLSVGVLLLTMGCQPASPTVMPTLMPNATATPNVGAILTASAPKTPTPQPVGEVLIPGLPQAPIPGRTIGRRDCQDHTCRLL